MISVIVPVYNTEKYLDRCVQSILAQTYTDFELLLIDDGSTDSSGAICDRYADQDSRVRVFHKENGGVSSARNLGLDNAIGEWITFCDSDDFVYHNWLENYDIDNNKSMYDLICQGVECSMALSINDRSNKYSFDFAGAICDGLKLLKEINIIGYTWIKLFKTGIIDKFGLRFNVAYKFMEDTEFVLRYMSFCKTMESVKKIGYFYNVPNWSKKYSDIYNYNLPRSLYMSCAKICGDEWSELLQNYIFGYDMAFDKMFSVYTFSNKRNLMLDYRDTLGVRILKSKRFFILKWLILIDVTGYISTTILIWYQSLMKNYLPNEKNSIYSNEFK